MMQQFPIALVLVMWNVILTQGSKNVIIEGDIIVTPRLAKVLLSQQENKRGAEKSNDNPVQPWIGGVVPYKFSSDIDQSLKKLINRAFMVYKKRTCIRFREATPKDKDYVEFIYDEGCYSSIGRDNGHQVISLGKGCDRLGHVLHELMHTIGFFHEQSRMDRDLYVKILWWNIADGAFKNFAQYMHGGLEPLNSKYDLQSILHYDEKAFTKNGWNTIEALDNPKRKLGGRRLSPEDVKKINKAYNC